MDDLKHKAQLTNKLIRELLETTRAGLVTWGAHAPSAYRAFESETLVGPFYTTTVDEHVLRLARVRQQFEGEMGVFQMFVDPVLDLVTDDLVPVDRVSRSPLLTDLWGLVASPDVDLDQLTRSLQRRRAGAAPTG